MASVTGGDKLDRVLRDIGRRLGTGGQVEVGWLDGVAYPSGTPVAMIAATNEYGVPSHNQPPRPFMRNLIKDRAKTWFKSDLLKANNYDIDKTLEETGALMKSEIQQSIRDLTSPPLAQSTIDRKGHDKPLEDTLLMLDTVNYRVKPGT